MGENKIMRLFEQVLRNYQNSSMGLPIRFDRTIALWLYATAEVDFDMNEETEIKIKEYLNFIFKNSSSTNTILLNMYFHLLYIEKHIDYSISHYLEFSKASFETSKIAEQKDDKDYWLFDWEPERIGNKEEFLNDLHKCKDLWEKESFLLKDTLEKLTLYNPYTENAHNLTYIFSILEAEPKKD